MTQPSRLHIFQAYGVELEYMIVDREDIGYQAYRGRTPEKCIGRRWQ